MSEPRRVDRTISLPRSVSEAAREALAAMYALELGDAAPPATDDEWEALVAFTDEMLLSILPPSPPGTTVASTSLGGVPGFEAEPEDRCSPKVCLFLHGGGFTMGGGGVCGAMTAAFAGGAQLRAIGVDYRMPPRYPFPAALDDCIAAYRWLLERSDPAEVVVAGISAGGNLAAALVLRARDEGLPVPSGLLLLSPETDLTETGDSFETLLGVDPVLRAPLTPSVLLYAGGHDLTDPHLSPLFGDLEGFPPTFLQCGTRDLLLSNTVRFHRALRRRGVRAALHVWDGMPHGGFGAMLEGGLGQVPEDQEVYDELRAFVTALP